MIGYITLSLKKDTTDTARSVSYLDLHIETDIEDRLSTNLYDKRDDYGDFFLYVATFQQHPTCGVYITQLIRHSRSCGSYHALLDGGLLATRKLLNQRFLVVKLK